MLTRVLLLAIAALAAAAAWRVARWHWRPRLVLPEGVRLERDASGVRVFLDVRNEGAGRSRRCRAFLLRCERREDLGWVRVDAPGGGHPALSPADESTIPAGETGRIRLDRPLPATPGTYRLEVAVLNGEEKRSSYVVVVGATPGDDPTGVEGTEGRGYRDDRTRLDA